MRCNQYHHFEVAELLHWEDSYKGNKCMSREVVFFLLKLKIMSLLKQIEDKRIKSLNWEKMGQNLHICKGVILKK